MKYIFFLIFLFLVSCGNETTTLDHTGEKGYNCYDNKSCNDKLVCNDDNKCEAINPCKDVTCSNNGTCAIANEKAICACDNGFHAVDLTCIADDKCINVECNSWEKCDYSNGECKLKNGYCNNENDCEQEDLCNDHKCEDLCINVQCSAWQVCKVENKEATCKVKEGFCEEDDLQYCTDEQICNYHKCINPCEHITCGDHGVCKLDGQERAKCECEAGYDLSDNMLNCTLSPKCSMANRTGTCEKLCEKCDNGACVPDGTGYLCDGGFNHLCDPAHDAAEGRNTDCGSAAPYCAKNPDDETKGYCYNYGCKTDIECNYANYDGRSQDNFFCFQYGYTAGQDAGTSRHLDGICMKAKAACTDISRDGIDFSACDNLCGDAMCSPTSWCMENRCIPECDPNQINSCTDGKECKNIHSTDFPLYRCVEVVGEGEDCGNLVKCVEGTICLDNGEQSWCLKTCNSENDTSCGENRACHPYGTGPEGYYCDGQKTQEIGEVCNLANNCKSDGVCLGTGSGDQYCMQTCTAAAETSADCDGRKCIAYGQTPNTDFFCDAPHTVAIGDVCTLGANCVEEAVCLGSQGASTKYCMQTCTAAAETSVECGDRKCNAYGTAPNDGFYCDAEANRNKLDACSLAHPCSGDLVCITHTELETGYCFNGCKTDGPVCSNNRECKGISQTTTDGYCNEGCMVDTDCTVAGETCLATFQCGVE